MSKTKQSLLLNCPPASSLYGKLFCIGTSHTYFRKFKGSKHVKYNPEMRVAPVVIKILSSWFSFPAIPVGVFISSQLGLTPSTKHPLMTI